MNLIQCDKDCKYQNEGYCKLDMPTYVNNVSSARGCVHFIEKKAGQPNLKRVTKL